MAKLTWAVVLLAASVYTSAVPVSDQHPLVDSSGTVYDVSGHGEQKSRLHGRFLQVTDFHPDPHYKSGSKTDKNHVCHGGSGNAGYFGAAGEECDSPWTLVDATMDWIRDNLRDSIDFVIWTGDSARHDNDEDLPRKEKEIVELNKVMVDKMLDVFSDNSTTKSIGNERLQKQLRVPIIPTIGNNDIMPHNIFEDGPNRWTKRFDQLWNPFIPEEQRHTFAEGGWFYVEVIPNKLAVVSLNTMYFYNSNSAVDGCKSKSEPGYEHFEWLRVQLQLLRERDMKAILIGHVPPSRSDSKTNWYESCWQKYALWLKQYRDVIVGSVYGHMNLDHYIIQDFHDIKIKKDGIKSVDDGEVEDDPMDDSMGAQSKADYLSSLRDLWSKLPVPPHGYSPPVQENDEVVTSRGKKKAKKKYLKKVGGPWAENYALAFVSPSVIPTYFPTVRVIEYNISGLEGAETWSPRLSEQEEDSSSLEEFNALAGSDSSTALADPDASKKKKKHKKKKKKKNNKFKKPKSPSSKSTPGPAYKNQPFTWLGYTQYYANITEFNARIEASQAPSRAILPAESDDAVYHGGKPAFEFEVEYDTKDDPIYRLEDMTVNSYLDLARRMSDSGSQSTDPALHGLNEDPAQNNGDNQPSGLNVSLAERPEPEATTHSRKVGAGATNRAWKAFLRRAFVNTRDIDE